VKYRIEEVVDFPYEIIGPIQFPRPPIMNVEWEPHTNNYNICLIQITTNEMIQMYARCGKGTLGSPAYFAVDAVNGNIVTWPPFNPMVGRLIVRH
jgi:hypothetical protein